MGFQENGWFQLLQIVISEVIELRKMGWLGNLILMKKRRERRGNGRACQQGLHGILSFFFLYTIQLQYKCAAKMSCRKVFLSLWERVEAARLRREIWMVVLNSMDG